MRTCSTCDFAIKIEGDTDGLLECHRNAIRAVGLDEDGAVVSAFPACEPDMWCGEYAQTFTLGTPNNYAAEWPVAT